MYNIHIHIHIYIYITFSSLGWSISSFPASRPRSGFSFLCLSTYRCSKIVSNRCRNTGRIYPQMIWSLPQMIDFLEIPWMKQHPRPKFLWRDVIFKSQADKSERCAPPDGYLSSACPNQGLIAARWEWGQTWTQKWMTATEKTGDVFQYWPTVKWLWCCFCCLWEQGLLK